MKKILKDILIFVFVFAFVVLGVFGNGYFKEIKTHTFAFFKNIKTEGFFSSFQKFTDDLENVSSEKLSYHKDLINVNSAFQYLEGIRIVEKDGMTVVRAENNYLSSIREKIENVDLQKRAENLEKLKKDAEENGAEFLYIMAPTKGYFSSYPDNADDYNLSNCLRFLEFLDNKNIPYFNIMERMESDGIKEEDMFFITDHHWRPEMAFWALRETLEHLDFPYDTEILDLDNYDVKTYENWFLGSQGKKVGKFFTPKGTDDIKLILPKFKTDLTEEQPYKEWSRRGEFKDVLMNLSFIENKDYYHLNPYAAYTGGDFKEQIVTNHKNPDGKTVLIIRDSFACAFTPFLSLASYKTHILDMRDFPEFGNERIDVKKYIEKIKPDYVLVLYTGVTASEVLYEFE